MRRIAGYENSRKRQFLPDSDESGEYEQCEDKTKKNTFSLGLSAMISPAASRAAAAAEVPVVHNVCILHHIAVLCDLSALHNAFIFHDESPSLHFFHAFLLTSFRCIFYCISGAE